MTNGDAIRSMTDDQLASLFGSRICDMIPASNCDKYDFGGCMACKRDWLLQDEGEYLKKFFAEEEDANPTP